MRASLLALVVALSALPILSHAVQQTSPARTGKLVGTLTSASRNGGDGSQIGQVSSTRAV